MTDVTADGVSGTSSITTLDPAIAARRLARRRAAEWRFQAYGIAAILFGLFFVALLFAVIGAKGWTALLQTQLTLPVTFEKSVIDPNGTSNHDDIMAADYTSLASAALYKRLGISPDDAAATALADGLISTGSDVELRKVVLDDPSVIGTTRTVTLLAHGNVDALLKGTIDRAKLDVAVSSAWPKSACSLSILLITMNRGSRNSLAYCQVFSVCTSIP